MNNNTAPKTVKPKNPGLLSRIIFLAFKLILISLLAWFVLNVWYLIISLLKSTGDALQQAEAILLSNIRFIEHSQSFLAESMSHGLYYFQQKLILILNYIGFAQYPLIQDYFQLLAIITEVTISRLFIFMMALPVLALTLLIGLTDGLIKRDIRKFQGARESTFTFHRVKNLYGFLFFIPFFIYLSMPMFIIPPFFLALQAVLLGWVTMLSVTYFKKYL